MYKKKKILAVIPARGGSKGVKLKNIRKINNLPLIAYVSLVLKDISMIDKCVVSTDSEKIKKVSESYDLEVPFYRPKNLSGDRISDLQVLTHTIRKIEKITKEKYEIIVMLPPTSPFRKSNDVIKTIKKLVNGKFDSVWTISEIDLKNHPLKLLNIKNESLEYYDERGKNIIARRQLSNLYMRNGYCYAFTRECLLDKKTIKGTKTGFIIIKGLPINIDTETDFKLAEFLVKQGGIKSA